MRLVLFEGPGAGRGIRPGVMTDDGVVDISAATAPQPVFDFRPVACPACGVDAPEFLPVRRGARRHEPRHPAAAASPRRPDVQTAAALGDQLRSGLGDEEAHRLA